MKISLAQTDAEREACYEVRRVVFIEEQDVSWEDERDAFDATARHFLGEADGSAVGTARVVGDGDSIKIGRVAVLQSHRGQGLGAKIMAAVVDDAKARGVREAKLESQLYAIPFYERFGFRAEGPEYDDGTGILHRMMHAKL